MHKPYHIIGHGIAGCTLAMSCYRRNIPFTMSGLSVAGEASMASSGLIAPVTGRRYVKTWRIDEFISFALDFYSWTEDLLGSRFFTPVEIVRFLSHNEAKLAWEKRLHDPEYAHYISEKKYDFLDSFNRPYGILTGGYRLDTPGWLHAVRTFLLENGVLNLISNPSDEIDLDGKTVIRATGITDAEGKHGTIPNKGEALIVKMPDWNIPIIVKDEIFVVPLESDLYWLGSYYQPWPADPFPSETGKKDLLVSLSRFYTGRVEVVEHLAGIRPTVDDRRPLIGPHPKIPGQFLFNGMGTKGTSLAPYWADQLILHLSEGVSLPDEISPARYSV